MPDMWCGRLSAMEKPEKDIRYFECRFREVLKEISRKAKRIIVIVEFEDEGEHNSSR